VKSNHALAKEVVEKMPLEGEDEGEAEASTGGEKRSRRSGRDRPEALGSRDNFWGK
jgi:hypothetical protein